MIKCPSGSYHLGIDSQGNAANCVVVDKQHWGNEQIKNGEHIFLGLIVGCILAFILLIMYTSFRGEQT
jgi:hypothetical protein